MTTEERFEHVTAGMAEQYRKDREEDRQLWRNTQRQLNELSSRVVQMGDELREADRRLGERIEQTNATVDRLAERIDKLVSGIGELTARLPLPPR